MSTNLYLQKLHSLRGTQDPKLPLSKLPKPVTAVDGAGDTTNSQRFVSFDSGNPGGVSKPKIAQICKNCIPRGPNMAYPRHPQNPQSPSSPATMAYAHCGRPGASQVAIGDRPGLTPLHRECEVPWADGAGSGAHRQEASGAQGGEGEGEGGGRGSVTTEALRPRRSETGRKEVVVPAELRKYLRWEYRHDAMAVKVMREFGLVLPRDRELVRTLAFVRVQQGER
jgi:hypothetical protein